MTNAIVPVDFDILQRQAKALYASKYFGDVQTEAQAIVKVMAGSELGLPPFASISGIHIIQGKPVLGANLIATLVKNDPRYDYRVKQADDTACVLMWYEGGEAVGESSFTRKEAAAGNIDKVWDKQAGGWKDKPTWKSYPSDMLFARAISRGARRFAPGIFGGAPIYTPDELGADVDEDGNVIEGEFTRDTGNGQRTEQADAVEQINDELFGPDVGTGGHTKPEPEAKPANGNGKKMMSNPSFLKWLRGQAPRYNQDTATADNKKIMAVGKMFGFDEVPNIDEPDKRKQYAFVVVEYAKQREAGRSKEKAIEAVVAALADEADEKEAA